ncbi:ribosomal protein subunit L23 [Schizosaccharomyces cryophilus OY26]|uniref:Large ribosomal subunit protein uL23m n=1 Tax=Schizosaccharomyces cryophilus (strain OY26 / ATCC MYA-4695 / CBS 11777 / NBRC 106824 / NRRL Y48691) TaxID=653667 RepID=S9XIJ2_SCHCR|nr:ribosomal protein subunit L23 [Schizosaccharomyces cryophilus OY26]EPY53471.1 ribosomal protein subunit L23 [Schizosaccharomyces cryophilus OY26]
MSKIAGKRLVYFPNIPFILYRGLNLPPNFAAFRVPLNVNKFDVRDYLLHVYNLKTLSVKTNIYQGSLYRNEYGQVRRQAATKRAIVEMEEPFIYPEVPKDLRQWRAGDSLPDGTSAKTLTRYPLYLEKPNMKVVNEELDKLQEASVSKSQQKISRLLRSIH